MLSQTAVASYLNRPQSVVAEIESGRRKIDVFELIEIARAVGAEPNAILEELLKARS